MFCRIAINPPGDFFNVNDNSIEVEPGTEVLVRVEPQELVMDDAAIDIPIDKRGCRMASEVPEEMSAMFKTYTRGACNFNCMFQYR